MNLTRAFIIFIGVTLVLMLMHFIVVYAISDNDIPVLYNIYGFAYLVGIPVFGIYLFIETKYSKYLSYAYFFLNVLKTALIIVWILYLIRLLELDVTNTFINLITVFFVFMIGELVPLFKLINSKKIQFIPTKNR
ncbi:MAG: hypothetical protein ACK5MD_09615 [Flavobacteriales bacterium]